MKNNWVFYLALPLLIASSGYTDNHTQENCDLLAAQGWSLDLGGQYTWMSFTTPPTFTGSTGGAHTRITYQKSDSFFGQIRSIYNVGSLTSSEGSSDESELYTELLGGYCFRLSQIGRASLWTCTPYAGIGLDFLNDHKSAHASISAIKLKYQLYYVLAGLDIHYTEKNWSVGAQADCFPTFRQYLSIGGLPGAGWKMNQRVGFAVRLPTAYRLGKNIWLEAAPYYRLLPIGASGVLGLPSRNLHQWGGFVTFRFYL
jgi:hypothetical protein